MEAKLDALEGVRVMDLTEGIAGPILGMLLADFGAEVIKVENPAGDPSRSRPGFAVWNRGKLGATLDPSVDADRAQLSVRIAGADVLICNGSDQLRRWGLPASEELIESHRRLVAVELPPYIDGFTPWAGAHESAELIAAISGTAARQASFSGDPVDSVYPSSSHAQGAWAAACTVAALLEREASGAGQRIVVSGMNGLQAINGVALMVDPQAPDPQTAVGASGRHPTYRVVQCGDGMYLACGALGVKFEPLLLRILSLEWVIEDPRLGGDIRNLTSPENSDWVRPLIDQAYLTESRQHWLDLMDAQGIPCAPVGSRDAWLDHEQVRAVGMRVEVDDPERGAVVMPGVPIVLTGTPGYVRGPAPALGQHNASLPEWSPQPDGNARPPLRPGPLAGYRIINLGSFIASPYGGSMLAELGAEVIKIEPPTGDPWRVPGYSGNRGMKSLAIDLQHERGLESFYRLVETADAVMDGMRPGVMTRLGLDYERLRAAKPDIVSLSLSGFGEGGPLGHRGGLDYVIQALCGMMAAQGGDDEPVSNTVSVNDLTTSCISAFGIVLGLFHRARTGQGQRIWDGLLLTGTYLQSEALVRYEGRTPSPVGGRDFAGPGPFDRLYRAADGWLRVQAGPATDGAAAAASALSIEPGDLETNPAKAMAEAIGDMPRDSAVAALNHAGLASVPARKVSEVIRDPRLREQEFVHVIETADPGVYLSGAGRYATFSRTGRDGPKVMAGVGEHTSSVLASAGLDDEAIASLVADGVVATGGPNVHRLARPYR